MKTKTIKRGRPGYWKNLWATKRDTLEANLKKITEAQANKRAEKMMLVTALFPQIPAGSLTSTQLRDSVMEAWNATYGDNMCKKSAWNLVLSCRRAGLFKRNDDGTYTVHTLNA